MRRSAIVALVFSAFMAGLGIANLVSDFLGGWVLTLIAFAGAAASLGLTLELRYVSRRIEDLRLAD
jgi:hypothetical protein